MSFERAVCYGAHHLAQPMWAGTIAPRVVHAGARAGVCSASARAPCVVVVAGLISLLLDVCLVSLYELLGVGFMVHLALPALRSHHFLQCPAIAVVRGFDDWTACPCHGCG